MDTLHKISEKSLFPLPEIDAKLERLTLLENDRKNESVDKMLLFLRDKLKVYLGTMNDIGVVALVHGSLQYNDPRNLDVDLGFFSQDKSFKELRWLSRYIQEEIETSTYLDGLEPIGKHKDSNLSTSSIKEIREELLLVDKKGSYSVQEDIFAELSASKLLSAKLLFNDPKQIEILEDLRIEGRKLLKSSRWLREGVNEILDEVFLDRESNRSGNR